jgi:hypothetical protein
MTAAFTYSDQSMSTHVMMDMPDTERLRIELRRSAGEVVRFGLFVLVVVSALYLLMPAARTEPGPLLAVLVAAGAWSAVALSASELYEIDREAATIEATRSSVLGRRRLSLTTREVAAVRLRIGGTDDNRRLVELISDTGVVRVTLPWRLTTLTVSAQQELGHTIASHLEVPLCDQTSRLG